MSDVRSPRSSRSRFGSQRVLISVAPSTPGGRVPRLRLELLHMRDQLLQRGPALQVQAEHLEGPQRRLAAGPQMDQQAGDDRAVRLDLDGHRVGAQEVAASQDVLEEAEEELDRPAI